MPNNIQHYCHNCNFWEWDDNIYLPDGSVIYPGHCGLYSCKCTNAVIDGDTPPHFQKMEVQDEERQRYNEHGY